MPESAQLSGDFIDSFYQSRDPGEAATTALRLNWSRPRTHENTWVTIFEGGHEMIHLAALKWLAAQSKGRPPVWNPARVAELEVSEEDSQSGK